MSGRVPPHNLESEAAVLSAVLLEGGPVLDLVVDLLAPEKFYSSANGWIWRAAVELHVAGKPIAKLRKAWRSRPKRRRTNATPRAAIGPNSGPNTIAPTVSTCSNNACNGRLSSPLRR